MYLTGKGGEEVHLEVKDAGALPCKYGVALPNGFSQGGVPSTLTGVAAIALENFAILVKNSARPANVALELRVRFIACCSLHAVLHCCMQRT